MRARTSCILSFALLAAGSAFAAAAAAVESEKGASPDEREKRTFHLRDDAVGSPLGAFSVASGDGDAISEKNLPGSVALITYESRETVEKNRAAKTALVEALKAWDAGGYLVIPVVDATSSNAFSRWMWRRKLREASLEEGLVIYGDWDGSARLALGAVKDDSNLVIVDAKGIIRYASYGLLDKEEISRIRALLDAMLAPPAEEEDAEATEAGDRR